MAGDVGAAAYTALAYVTGHRERADRQPVESVGEIHRVRGRHQHEGGEEQIPHAEIRNEPLEERKDQTRAVEAVMLEDQQRAADREADDNLVAHLEARPQTVMRSAHD